MNTTLYPSTTHPPDTEGRQVLALPDPGELRALRLADRLSLKVGLWLLARAQRPRKAPLSATDAQLLRALQHTLQQEKLALLRYDMQRHLL